MVRVRVWDLPTRLFHWLLVLAVAGLLITANLGGFWMDWHMRLGMFVLSLLIFRLLWGVVGGRWSRFSSFLYSPSSLLAYLRGQAPLVHRVGHTPLGALSVFALLGILLFQVATGLFTDDAIFFSGPLVVIGSSEWIEWASRYHKGMGKFLVLGLVGLHLLALLIYKIVKKQALVAAMVHGDKVLNEQAPSSSDRLVDGLKAMVVYLLACGLTYLIISLGGH
ncbi:MAG: cytochrome b/b6 domain-containing protein [Burkholderiaceae bacterium]|nr:cytochrome b/b6 domain-containing protein [Burkholderiaceae bacterium]